MFLTAEIVCFLHPRRRFGRRRVARGHHPPVDGHERRRKLQLWVRTFCTHQSNRLLSQVEYPDFWAQLRVGGRQERGDDGIQQADRGRRRRHVDARILFLGRGRCHLHRRLGGRRVGIPSRGSTHT